MSDLDLARARAKALRLRIEAESRLKQQDTSFLEGAGRSFSTELTRNVLNIPEAAARGMATMAAASPRLPGPFGLVSDGIRAVTGEDPQAVGLRTMMNNERLLPEVTPEQAFAGLRMAVSPGKVLDQGIPKTYADAVETEQAISARMADEAPVGTAVGDVVADGVTLFMGRLPATLTAKNTPQMMQVAENAVQAQTTIPGAIKGVMTSGPMKKLARGVGRAGETSLEAATLTFLNDPEISPEEASSVAGGAAAGQALGSAGLTALSTFARHPAKFTAGVIIMVTGARTMQEFGPGENNIFDAADDVFENAKYGILLGAAGAVMGAGRVKPENASKAVRAIADGVTSIPRGAAISLMKEALTDGEDGVISDVMGKVMQSPDSFTPAQIKRLERAVMNEKTSVRAEINKMMQSDDFRTRVEAVGSGALQSD